MISAGRWRSTPPLPGIPPGDQRLRASLIFVPYCLTLPLAWSRRPLACSRRFPVRRPTVFMAEPLTASALCAIFLPILMGGCRLGAALRGRACRQADRRRVGRLPILAVRRRQAGLRTGARTGTASCGVHLYPDGTKRAGSRPYCLGDCWLQTRGKDETRLGLVPPIGPGLGRITCPGCSRHACSDRRRSRRCQPTSGCAPARPCRGGS
jgi:hypothetical protein